MAHLPTVRHYLPVYITLHLSSSPPLLHSTSPPLHLLSFTPSPRKPAPPPSPRRSPAVLRPQRRRRPWSSELRPHVSPPLHLPLPLCFPSSSPSSPYFLSRARESRHGHGGSRRARATPLARL